MSYKEFIKDSGLLLTDEEARAYIGVLFEYYELKKAHLTKERQKSISINIIKIYTNYINKKDFNVIYGDYKNKYIFNESLVEPGVTKEERKGLGVVYDYICAHHKDKDINIVIDSLTIHSKLYSCCPNPEFGGKLRTETAFLYDTPYDVLPGNMVISEFNKYFSYKLPKPTDDILDYIDACINLIVELIKLQPFVDGNKRTFRALLNLLLKKVSIPPIYIKKEERQTYMDNLLKAICDNEYSGLYNFYYQKIADSIISLDIYSHDNSLIYNSLPKKKILTK